jgi:hypothetical protein
MADAQTSPPRERSPPPNGPGPRSPPRTVRAPARRRSRRRGRSPTPRGCRSSMPRTSPPVRPKLKPAMSAPLVIEPATDKRPVLLAKRSHRHVRAPVEEDDDEAVPPDEAPQTRRFGPWGRVLAYFCLALAALSLRPGHVKAPVVPRLPKNVASPHTVQPRRRRLPGVKLGRSGLLVAGAAARPVLRPVATFFTRRPVLRKIGGFVARAGISNTAMRGLRKVVRRAIPVLKTR